MYTAKATDTTERTKCGQLFRIERTQTLGLTIPQDPACACDILGIALPSLDAH